MPKIVLALGSNIGDRIGYLNSAIAFLEEKVKVSKVSSWLQNPAVGGPEGQGDFFNGVVTGSTSLSPYELLEFVKGIEVELGRDLAATRWSARVIDIDIIFYGGAIINSETLVVPHKLMHERSFVLEPLCEVEPDWVHPVMKCCVEELLERYDK